MTEREDIMSLPLSGKFQDTANLAIAQGLSKGEAMAMLEIREQQDGHRTSTILALTDASEYQPLLRAMADVPRINVFIAKQLLEAMMKQQGHENNIEAIPGNHTTENRSATIHADAGYAGESYDADTIERILKTI
ncbi:hypothetical protein HVV80_15335 [Escherichia coli]|nr:hypothetical protein [Escherichia coli]